MRALIQKELRENLKLAVLGLVVVTLMLLQMYRNYGALLKPLAAGGTEPHGAYLQPLANGEILVYIGGFCSIFALLLGWLQSFNERHHDLWSFLAHRPLTRTQLFLGKMIAGLTLYFIVAGIPLACFIGWAITPGHVAAPFEWPMLLPLAALFLAGPLYYFAGILTGLRKARWYASRGLAVGGAILVSIGTFVVPHFWEGVMLLSLGAAILGTATWGGFHSNGFYRGQPRAGGLALTAAFTLGAIVVSLLAAALVDTLMPRWASDDYSWSYYALTKDGTVCRLTQASDRPEQIEDMQGQPLLDAKTGRPVTRETFVQARGFELGVDFGDRPRPRRYYFHEGYVRFYRATPYTLWYYSPRYGRLTAYDARTRKPAGSLGPDGFAGNLAVGGARFDDVPGGGSDSRTLKAKDELYKVDLDNRSATKVFTAAPGESIGASMDLTLNDYEWAYTAVVTRRQVYLLRPNGQAVWEVPYQPGYPEYDAVQVSVLERTNQFALWFRPEDEAARRSPRQHPTRLIWLAGSQIVKTADLPDLSRPLPSLRFRERLLAGVNAPALLALLPILFDQSWPRGLAWEMVLSSLAVAAVVCMPLGWWLTRRYSFSLGSQIGWAVFHLITGVPGLLAFLSVQEWVAREPCPKCGKLRVVDRENCEHCAAAWPSPQPIGIEIFEPVK
jgi:hypothetical protein